ncbi:hypothetical protein JNW88_31725 [Micromonospora sp. ATA32]|nr:hypothetical protein [Micromonospora sp. ATA32]
MTNLQDVIAAWNQAEQAREEAKRAEDRYREVVRAAIADGVRQTEIAKALDRTREMIRRDAMPDEQREALKATRRRRTHTH